MAGWRCPAVHVRSNDPDREAESRDVAVVGGACDKADLLECIACCFALLIRLPLAVSAYARVVGIEGAAKPLAGRWLKP